MFLSIEMIFYSSVLISAKMITMFLSICVYEGICWISMVRNQKCDVRTCNTPINFLQDIIIIMHYQDIEMK